ncbi:MAG: hypothetical protein KDK78_00850 [Chlamydiia bacterium]|nr:hypothetical protein [Chlamydiia bacterium]
MPGETQAINGIRAMVNNIDLDNNNHFYKVNFDAQGKLASIKGGTEWKKASSSNTVARLAEMAIAETNSVEILEQLMVDAKVLAGYYDKESDNWKEKVKSWFGFGKRNGIDRLKGIQAKCLAAKNNILEARKLRLEGTPPLTGHKAAEEMLRDLVKKGVSSPHSAAGKPALIWKNEETGRYHISYLEVSHKQQLADDSMELTYKQLAGVDPQNVKLLSEQLSHLNGCTVDVHGAPSKPIHCLRDLARTLTNFERIRSTSNKPSVVWDRERDWAYMLDSDFQALRKINSKGIALRAVLTETGFIFKNGALAHVWEGNSHLTFAIQEGPEGKLRLGYAREVDSYAKMVSLGTYEKVLNQCEKNLGMLQELGNREFDTLNDLLIYLDSIKEPISRNVL